MKEYHLKQLFFMPIALVMSIALYSTAQAQVVEPSTGRSNGETVDVSGASYKAIKRIRKLINEQKYDSAAKRAIRFIKSEESGFKRTGTSRSSYYLEAYNCLCVSSTGTGKVDYAMEACNQSLTLDPTNWESYKSRATLYFLTKDYESSLADFELALKNAPEKLPEVADVLKQNIAVVRSKL